MKKQSGFTMVELMVTLLVAGALLAVGLPSLRETILDSRTTMVTNELVSALHVARSEAIRQNSAACVCSSTTASNAVPSCSGGNTWETGWIAFLDANGNCAIEAGIDNLLKVWDGTDYIGKVTVRTDDVSITGTNTISFNSRGEPKINGVSQQGTFSICDSRPLTLGTNGDSITSTAVILGVSGRVIWRTSVLL